MKIKQMRLISIVWGCILFLIVSTLTVFGFIYKNKIKKYEELESKLVNATEKYVDEKFLYPEEGKVIKINASELKESEKITDLVVNDIECDGYVNVSYNGKTFSYKAYITCPEYKTKGA